MNIILGVHMKGNTRKKLTPTTIFLLAATLYGCTVNQATLQQYGDVKLDGNLLKSITITHNEIAEIGKLPACVASNVTNESVSVHDTAGSFVGSYTGNYYQVNRAREVGGGNIIQYISQDGTEVIARGTMRYTAAMIERATRFTLSIKDDGISRKYIFNNVEVAQMNTGNWPNSGYQKAAMNPGTGGGHILKNMKALANDIDSCMR